MDFEKRRLQENGYIGDIDDKMFKAGRYYFRKKTLTAIPTHAEIETPKAAEQETPETPKTPAATTAASRRTYITMSKQCIRMMDDHISAAAAAAITTTATATATTQFKPSTCYDDFYETQMTTPEMTKEIENIIEKYEKTPGAMANLTAEQLTVEIMDKIKKTYKNRYYKYISASRNNNADNNNNNKDDAENDEN